VSKLPILSGEKLCKVLGKIGYEIDHQTGSHIIVRHIKPPHRRITIPNHKVIAKGTLRKIIKESGLSLEEFKKLSK